jgi:hypothetical protein
MGPPEAAVSPLGPPAVRDVRLLALTIRLRPGAKRWISQEVSPYTSVGASCFVWIDSLIEGEPSRIEGAIQQVDLSSPVARRQSSPRMQGTAV